MTCQWRGLFALAICTIAASCADPSPKPVPAAPAVSPIHGPVSINGVYNGVMRISRGPAMSCGTQDMFTLRVANNAFHYDLNQPQVPWQPVRSFDVVIAADGSFQTQPGAAYIRGYVSGSHMQGEIVGDACGYHFEADNAGTW